VRRGVVALGVGREVDQVVGGVVGHRDGRPPEARGARRSGGDEQREERGDERERNGA
jgi:hypothetical protein